MEANGLPSRTSILTAAARAFGSREPDASVRNPDWLAERLIGPAELALIADHPISKAFDRDFREASHDPDIFGFAWLMLVRTRYIDERSLQSRRSGSAQRESVLTLAGRSQVKVGAFESHGVTLASGCTWSATVVLRSLSLPSRKPSGRNKKRP